MADGNQAPMVRTPTQAGSARRRAASRRFIDSCIVHVSVLVFAGLLLLGGACLGGVSETPSKTPTSSFKSTARLSIDVRDAEVQNVLRLIASRAGLNLVMSSQVQGKVTLRLVNVSVQEALQAVLMARGLGAVSSGAILRIAPLTELEQEAAAQVALQEAKNEASLLETRLIRLWNADAHALQVTIQPFLSSRGKLEVDTRTNTLIVTDTPDTVRRIVRLIQGPP